MRKRELEAKVDELHRRIRDYNSENRDLWKTIDDLQEERGRLERELSWERGNRDRAARERDLTEEELVQTLDAIDEYGLVAVDQEDGTVRLEPTPEAELSANVVKAYTVDEKIDAIVRYLTEDRDGER